MCINTIQYRHDPSIISKQKMVTLKHLNWHCRLTSFHHCQYVVCHSISFHMTGILASPAHARFKPMQFGVCRIRKAWRNWRCGVVCLTLFDKAVYKCLHWFLLEKRLFMHRYALQNQVVSWWTVVLPKPLVFSRSQGFGASTCCPGIFAKQKHLPDNFDLKDYR